MRASRCPFLPRHKHEYERNRHDRSRYQDRLECTWVDVYTSQLHERQREYGEEPKSYNDSYEVVVPLQESGDSKLNYFFPVAADAFSSVARYVCWDSA